MAKTVAPLLSFEASGTLAKSLVFAKWRGIPYARRHVIPENPQTVPQELTRNVFRNLNAMWRNAPALLRAPWTRYAAGRPFLDRNAFVGQNVATSRARASWDAFIASPGASGGIPPNTMTVTPGVDTLTVTFDLPSAPSGWVLTSAVATAFPNDAPDGPLPSPIVAAEDTTDPFSVVLSGLAGVGAHVVAGWLVWTKEGNRLAYSPSLVQVATPT